MRKRRNGGLLLTSIKSDIGYAQQGAGTASGIKLVRTMHHGAVPATLRVDSLTPQVDWLLEQLDRSPS